MLWYPRNIVMHALLTMPGVLPVGTAIAQVTYVAASARVINATQVAQIVLNSLLLTLVQGAICLYIDPLLVEALFPQPAWP